MQKGLIFLLIICSSSFASGNTPNHLQFSLGCQAVIPCQLHRCDSDSFKWFHKKDEDTIPIYFQDKTGVKHYQQLLRPRMKVTSDCSLVIANFTEDDQGLYWCEDCFHDNCWYKLPTAISVKKDIMKETRETFYVIAGSSFTHACPAELTTGNFKWIFEANNMPALRNSIQGPESDFMTSNHSLYKTSNKTIHIANITRANAGKYTCWKTGCDGYRWKLLTINLCVITVPSSEDSSVSCAVMCDIEFSNTKLNSTLNVETGTGTISVLIAPNGSLSCSAKQMFDGHSTVNSTHRPSNAVTRTTDEPEYQIQVMYGISAVLTCLIVMALLICCLRRRLQAAFPVHFCGCSLNGRVEEEPSVVYSSIVFKGTAKTSNNSYIHANSRCVYSELNI